MYIKGYRLQHGVTRHIHDVMRHVISMHDSTQMSQAVVVSLNCSLPAHTTSGIPVYQPAAYQEHVEAEQKLI